MKVSSGKIAPAGVTNAPLCVGGTARVLTPGCTQRADLRERREAHFLNLPSSSFPSFSLDRRTKSYHKKCKVSLPFPEHLTPSFRAVCELAPPANGTFSDCFCTLASGPSRPHSAAGTHSCRQPVLTKPWLPRGRQHALSFF